MTGPYDQPPAPATEPTDMPAPLPQRAPGTGDTGTGDPGTGDTGPMIDPPVNPDTPGLPEPQPTSNPDMPGLPGPVPMPAM